MVDDVYFGINGDVVFFSINMVVMLEKWLVWI